MVVRQNKPLNQKEKRPPTKKYTQKLGKVIQIDANQIQEHLGELVRGTFEDTLPSAKMPLGKNNLVPVIISYQKGQLPLI